MVNLKKKKEGSSVQFEVEHYFYFYSWKGTLKKITPSVK